MVGPPEITIEFSVAATTDSGVFPLTVPSDDVAVIVIAVLLIVRAVTNPPTEVVATAVFADAHVAANGVRVSTGTEALAGVTAIDCSTGAVPVSAAVPTTLFTVAVIVVDPGVKVVADPPGAIVATDVLDEAHVAVIVRSLVVLLLYVPRAVNARGRPAATDAVAGETVIEERVGPLPLLHPASAPAIITTMVNRSFFMGELHLANRVFFT